MRQRMQRHFSEIAGEYGSLRRTDDAPIRHIRTRLAGRGALMGLDVGCGDGRYDSLLLRLCPELRLTCIDPVAEMLGRAEARLRLDGVDPDRVRFARRAIEDWSAAPRSYDSVFAFNVIHHLEQELLFEKARAALRRGGSLFIYTRLPQQNRRTVWGRYFPEFAERETRLPTLEALLAAAECTGGFSAPAVTAFRYPRETSIDRLLRLVSRRHYSTFALYEPPELEEAMQVFERRLRATPHDPRAIRWVDENVLLEFRRDGTGRHSAYG